MKYLLIFLSLCFIGCTDNTENRNNHSLINKKYLCDELKNSLSDFRGSSSYLRICFEHQDEKGIIIVENSIFFELYGKDLGMNRKMYVDLIYDKIKSNHFIKLSDDQLMNLREYQLYDDTIDLNVDNILNNYFNNTIQKTKLPHRNAIISALIKDGYEVSIDDETGMLVLNKCD